MRQSGFESHSKPLGTDHLQHDFESSLAAQLRWRCPAPCVDGSIDLRIGAIDLLVEPGDEYRALRVQSGSIWTEEARSSTACRSVEAGRAAHRSLRQEADRYRSRCLSGY